MAPARSGAIACQEIESLSSQLPDSISGLDLYPHFLRKSAVCHGFVQSLRAFFYLCKSCNSPATCLEAGSFTIRAQS